MHYKHIAKIKARKSNYIYDTYLLCTMIAADVQNINTVTLYYIMHLCRLFDLRALLNITIIAVTTRGVHFMPLSCTVHSYKS